MRMGWEQLRTFDHRLLLVILLLVVEEPILTGLEAGNDGMSSRCRMLGCMLARRTVTATDVPTLRTSAKMKPPIAGGQTLHASGAAWRNVGVNACNLFLHVSLPGDA